MKLSRVTLYMLLTAGCRAAYVQFQDCSEPQDSSSLIPESFRASVKRGENTFDWKFDFIAGLTNRNSCEIDFSTVIPRFVVVDYANNSPYISGQIVNKSCFTTQRLGSRSKFTIATSFNRSTLLDTYLTTFELANSDNTALSCVRAVLTPAVPRSIRLLGLWLPIVTFALACIAACWPVRQGTGPNTAKNSLVARAIDVLAYIQFIFFSGALSLQYPGFFQPLVGLSGWSTLMLPVGVVETGSPYARAGVKDGIYEHNGTITGAPGLELLTQMTGSAVKPLSWMNTFVLSLLVFVSLYIISYIIYRLKNTHSSPRSGPKDAISLLKTQYWTVVRLFLSCFMLPLSAWATYQFLDGTIFGYQNSMMAILVLSLLLAGFYWSWSNDPEMASLVLQGSSFAGRDDGKRQKYCVLIVFLLMLLRGCVLGGLQTYNSVQVALILACETTNLTSIVYWIGFSHFTSLPGILSMTRIALFSMHIGFLPGVTDYSGKTLVAYIILFGHLIVLICIFLIPILFDIGKHVLGRHPIVITDVENSMSVVAADVSTPGESNELAKYPSSHSSRSNKSLFDMIAIRETKLFGDTTVSRIPTEVLSLFMRNVQGEDKNTDICGTFADFSGSSSTLVGSTQPDTEIKSVTDISPDVLSAYLASEENLAVRQTSTYQDMNRPINEYFISTSHNTYLLGRQVATRSKLEGYVEALSQGCRSVEIDCWDGRNGQPIVKHGYSLTKSISFRSVINTIKQHAFLGSDLPLWLSLEVHCSRPQRDIMAQVMMEIFGSSLITEPLPECLDTMPSPNLLLGKILLKVKILHDLNSKDNEGEAHDSVKIDLEPNEAEADPEERAGGTTIIHPPQRKTLQEDLLQSLAVYGAGKRLPSRDMIDSHRNFIYSISETNLRKRINKEQSLGLAGTQHMVRVYPDPNRVDSSNFDPIKCWKHGVQMVALNYQTADFNKRLNDAMFVGSLGYVPKTQPESKRIRIAVDILMMRGFTGLGGDIPVYVEVELLLPDMSSQKVRTTAVSARGADAIFDQNLDISMETKYPHLAFLHWSVKSLCNNRPTSICSGIAKRNLIYIIKTTEL
ncbi:1-phosphatidylinositol- -bisphosphate phosphodiesterase [Fusarium longipes]|uniref:Phosphoinositide phospholipase C n=1 Tax=Fusarium longipes TaxID=694270 RepID=A0A395SZB3_9HYPO|nr:1-phosphatidylinositol- -bisphosphate phosphodiesterase [Fusarium longipes]